ncbi:MAG: (Fe-S)-binding protein, partial [Solirubrobacterales bacterium]|nr:(Fe-S)-binding protein [Solirubrobacterales bacterium]
VECGFCEPVCPSRDLTTTPRQRIVLRREMARQPAGSPLLAKLIEEFEYDGLQTCAADGTCATTCPLGIDTGSLVKELRAAEQTEARERAALRAARRWDRVEAGARSGLAAGAAVAGAIGEDAVSGIAAAARSVVSSELLPGWQPPMPPPADAPFPPTVKDGAAAVYLPSCVNRMFGRDPAGRAADPGGPASIQEALIAVSLRAGRPVWIPAGVAGTCCGTPWASKGYRRGAHWMAERTVAELWEWSDRGRIPVVIDATSCTHGLTESAAGLGDAVAGRLAEMTILDSVQWAASLIGELEVRERAGTVVVHPTCSGAHLGLNGELAVLAAALADEVVVPPSASCCGFAGDRGFLHPELTAAATAPEAAEVRAAGAAEHVCSNRTCEIGMQRATGESYESLVFLLERLSR